MPPGRDRLYNPHTRRRRRGMGECNVARETDFRATPRGLSHFLRIIGNVEPRRGKVAGGLCVRKRPPSSVGNDRYRALWYSAWNSRQLGVKGQIGGKTGTAQAARACWMEIFAGIVFDRANIARYTVLTMCAAAASAGARRRFRRTWQLYLLSTRRTEISSCLAARCTRPLRRQSNTGAVLDQHPFSFLSSLVRRHRVECAPAN